jgi:RHS repeat-associated protein
MIPQNGYAPNGNILAHYDSVMGDWLFSYDAVDRLMAASASLNAPAGFKGQTAAWSYDSYGNRTAQSFANGVSSVTVSYNPANNRINTVSGIVPSYVYDASGNTLFDGKNEYWYDAEVPVDRSSSTGWEAEGQLCAVASANAYGIPVAPVTGYLYDAEGARIGKVALAAPPASSTSLCAPPSVAALNAPGVATSGVTVTARYLVDLGGDQVTELNMQNGTTAVPLGWAHSNIFSAARLTATYDTKGLHYELADPLGTKRVQANISGQIEESCVSLTFGDALTCTQNPALSTADDATEHHFTGKERDVESGNDYFFARYYNSAIGRFTTPDWSAKVVPVPYAKLDNPQSLNLYAYVGNNPLRSIDPDGHADVAAMCKGQAVCHKTIVDTVGIYHYDKKSGQTVLDSTLKVTSNFTLTTDSKGHVSSSVSSTVENVSGHQYSSDQLAFMGKVVGLTQQSAVMMGFGDKTTQMMTALGAAETQFGASKPGESAPWKAPSINPLQLSGGKAKGKTLEQNIEGALGVFDYFGKPQHFNPIPTYQGYSDGSVPTMANFTSTYNSVSEDQK